MATNFQKFNKLATTLKKVADNNPEIKARIIAEADTSSKNSWNKIQKWASQKIFQDYKQKGIRFFTEKKIEKIAREILKLKIEDNTCFDVFSIPEADLGTIQPFDLERTLMGFPSNLQIQISIEGGFGINTTIDKISNLENVGNGDLTKGIRELYPNLADIGFSKLKKVKAKGKFTCNYYIKIHFIDANDVPDLTDEEFDRLILEGTQLSDLTPEEREKRINQKTLVDKAFKQRKKDGKDLRSKKDIREIQLPKKVTEQTKDDEIENEINDRDRTKKLEQFNKALDRITKLYEDKLLTKKQFSDSFDKLNKNLSKGGEI